MERACWRRGGEGTHRKPLLPRVEKGSVLLFQMSLRAAATHGLPATPANSPNSQATAQVTPAPPVCQSSATVETIRWGAPRQESAASQNPARTETESPDPVPLCLNIQPPPPPLATLRAHLSGALRPAKDSTDTQ